MLKTVNPIIEPELLYMLAKMGHGDEIILSDIHFPAYSCNDNVLQARGSEVSDLAGTLAAEKMIKALNGKKGKVAMMSYTAGSGSAIDRDGGFKDTIEAAGYEVVGPFYSNADMVTALNQTVDVLASNKDLVGIFGSNEPTAVGMARAIQQRGYTGKIVAVAFDGNQDIQQFIRDGVLDGAIVQSSYGMGFLGINAVADILAGKKIESFIDTGVVYVTKDNIDSKKAQAVLY